MDLTTYMIERLIPISLLLTAIILAWRYPRSHHLVKAGLAFIAAIIMLWFIVHD